VLVPNNPFDLVTANGRGHEGTYLAKTDNRQKYVKKVCTLKQTVANDDKSLKWEQRTFVSIVQIKTRPNCTIR
jgi:hypothetical protein